MSRPPLGSHIHFAGLSIAWYGLLIVTGVVLAVILGTVEEKRRGLPSDTVVTTALWAVPLGVIGARLYYVAFNWGRFLENPIEILYLWQGGLAIYGAILGGLLGVCIASRIQKVKLITLMDIAAPGLVLAQAIGRWGNYANMEAYGSRLYDAGLQWFPLAVEIPLITSTGAEYWYWHMATFFYESILCFAVFLFLWLSRKRFKRAGDATAWYLLLYGAGRIIIEGLRDDSLMITVSGGQARISQIVSALMVLGVLIVFFVRLMRTRKAHATEILGWCIFLLSLVLAFLGEFERNAYANLFSMGQTCLGAILVLDLIFLLLFFLRAKRFAQPAVWIFLLAGAVVVALWIGIPLAGEGNSFYVTLRQVIAMLHAVFVGAWFYLRSAPRKEGRHVA